MDNFSEAVHSRISKKILSLEDNPSPRGVKKLIGREEYRLRVGNYRVLYTVNDEDSMVTVFAVVIGGKHIAEPALIKTQRLYSGLHYV